MGGLAERHDRCRDHREVGLAQLASPAVVHPKRVCDDRRRLVRGLGLALPDLDLQEVSCMYPRTRDSCMKQWMQVQCVGRNWGPLAVRCFSPLLSDAADPWHTTDSKAH